MISTILAYIVRIFELPLLLLLNLTSFETLDIYFNAFYATFLTITTVGYGTTATIAYSTCGRIVLIATTFCGAILISMFVFVATNYLEFHPN